MKPKIEFVVYTVVHIFAFYGLWYTVYQASHDYKNLNKLIGYALVETYKFLPSLGRRFKYVTQDVSNNDEWNELLKFIVYCSAFLLYIPVSIVGSIISRMAHQLLRTSISMVILFYLLGSYIVLDLFFMTVALLTIGWIFKGYPIMVWFTAIPALHYSVKILEDTILLEVKSFGSEIAPLLLNGIYSTHFMALLRAISLALFVCNRSWVQTEEKNNSTSDYDKGNGDGLHTPEQQSNRQPTFFTTLLDALEYAFYLPTVVYGPLVTYADWNNFIYQKTPPRFIRFLGRFRRLTVMHLVGRAIRLMLGAAFWSTLTCFLYPKAILSYPMYLNKHSVYATRNPWSARGIRVPSWTVWCCLNLAGIGFYFFHIMIYGIPGLIADTEQYTIDVVQGWKSKAEYEKIEKRKKKYDGFSLCLVAAPPSCVFRITLFSEMWRTFDRGLYGFMYTHIYLPLRGDRNKSAQPSHRYSKIQLLRTILASCLPFFFVLLFHSVNKQNTIWIFVNLAQFFVEKLIRWADTNTAIGRKLREPACMDWRHRLLALLHSVSLMSSLFGLIFFLYGYQIGIEFAKHILFSYGSLVQLVAFYGLYFMDNYREKYFSRQGLPLGMYDAPSKRK